MEFHLRHVASHIADKGSGYRHISNKNKDLNTLSGLDWEELHIVVDILWVFNDITPDISAEQSVTISKVLYFVKIMGQHVNNEKLTNLDTKPNCQKLLKVLREKLNDRFSAYEENPCTEYVS